MFAALLYVLHAGTGVADPTHVICCTALGNPVLSIAEPTVPVCGRFWKRPMPPRTTARGPRAAPANDAICAPVPYVHEKPARGLKYTDVGRTLFLRLYSVSSDRFSLGVVRNCVASMRTPYVNWRFGVRRYESPRDRPSTACWMSRLRGDSVRVNDAGEFAWRSASEL